MNQTARVNRWEWHLGLALVLVAMASAPVAAQDGNVKDSPLFHEYLADSSQVRESCIDGLTGGLRTLRMIVATLP
jgi:hypothetical protein